MRRQRVAHAGLHHLGAIHVVHEMLYQRLVGTVKAGMHACGCQLLRRSKARGLAFEHPAFHVAAAPARLAKALYPGVQRALQWQVKQPGTCGGGRLGHMRGRGGEYPVWIMQACR